MNHETFAEARTVLEVARLAKEYGIIGFDQLSAVHSFLVQAIGFEAVREISLAIDQENRREERLAREDWTVPSDPEAA